MEAILYIGHGSRRKEANEQFISFLQQAMPHMDIPIQEVGFLELASPSIQEAMNTCIRKGATHLIVIPVLLLSGIHANVDIPEQLNRVQSLHPDVKISYGSPLGPDRHMTEILLTRLRENGYQKGSDSGVLLVGHGSRDPDFKIQFEKIAASLSRHTNPGLHISFLKASNPVFADELGRMLTLPYEKIYILPYFLFTGGFTEMMKEIASSLDCKGKKIVFCNPVGFDEKLIHLLKKRVEEANEVRG